MCPIFVVNPQGCSSGFGVVYYFSWKSEFQLTECTDVNKNFFFGPGPGGGGVRGFPKEWLRVSEPTVLQISSLGPCPFFAFCIYSSHAQLSFLMPKTWHCEHTRKCASANACCAKRCWQKKAAEQHEAQARAAEQHSTTEATGLAMCSTRWRHFGGCRHHYSTSGNGQCQIRQKPGFLLKLIENTYIKSDCERASTLCNANIFRHGQSKRPRGNVSAPGIFLDPCPSSGLLGGALRGRT